MQDQNPRVSLWEIAKLFFKIGATGFGGGIAIIAIIQDFVVLRKRWLSLEEYSHGVALGQVLGPFAVNVSIFVGYRIRGWRGAVTAAIAFMAPSIILVMILTELYLRFHTVPSMQSALKGLEPVVVALILSAAYSMVRAKLKSVETIGLIVFGAVLSLMHVPVVLILLAAAIYGIIKLRFARREVQNEEV